MNCKEFEKWIPAFISQEMDYRKLKSFKEHFKSCPGCKEELVIQFLVTEGMARLEEGSAFDLQKELDRRMEEAERKVRFHHSFLYAGLVLEAAAMLTIAGIVAWIIF